MIPNDREKLLNLRTFPPQQRKKELLLLVCALLCFVWLFVMFLLSACYYACLADSWKVAVESSAQWLREAVNDCKEGKHFGGVVVRW